MNAVQIFYAYQVATFVISAVAPFSFKWEIEML